MARLSSLPQNDFSTKDHFTGSRGILSITELTSFLNSLRSSCLAA